MTDHEFASCHSAMSTRMHRRASKSFVSAVDAIHSARIADSNGGLAVKLASEDLKTADGPMDYHVFVPSPSGSCPAIIFYFDAFGIRPDAFAMAERLAAMGYAVAMPDLYHRSGPFPPFSAHTAFKDPAERARLYALIATTDNDKVMADTAIALEYLGRLGLMRGSKIGCVGYCLGGQFALSSAARFPDRVAAAASIHGVSLATERSDSPHLAVGKARARIYVALAEHDTEFSPEEAARLRAALAASGVPHEIEVYPGTRHGFAVTGRLVYDEPATTRHWQKLAQLFDETL